MVHRRFLFFRKGHLQPQPSPVRHPHKTAPGFHQITDLLAGQVHTLHFHQHLEIKPVDLPGFGDFKFHGGLHRVGPQGFQIAIQLHRNRRRQAVQPFHKFVRKRLGQPGLEELAGGIPAQSQIRQLFRHGVKRPAVKPRQPSILKAAALLQTPGVFFQHLAAEAVVIGRRDFRLDLLGISRRSLLAQLHLQQRLEHGLDRTGLERGRQGHIKAPEEVHPGFAFHHLGRQFVAGHGLATIHPRTRSGENSFVGKIKIHCPWQHRQPIGHRLAVGHHQLQAITALPRFGRAFRGVGAFPMQGFRNMEERLLIKRHQTVRQGRLSQQLPHERPGPGIIKLQRGGRRFPGAPITTPLAEERLRNPIQQ